VSINDPFFRLPCFLIKTVCHPACMRMYPADEHHQFKLPDHGSTPGKAAANRMDAPALTFAHVMSMEECHVERLQRLRNGMCRD
jgi:hypothetical protein